MRAKSFLIAKHTIGSLLPKVVIYHTLTCNKIVVQDILYTIEERGTV